MQRPRRTSEFHDDRRQSRAPQRSVNPSPSTATKFPTRSRIAVPARSKSIESGGGAVSNSAFLSVPSGTTPLSTKHNTNRVLFTAEKNRVGNSAGGGGAGPLHNDKKWVHEQTQRITEYLLHQPTIGGLSSDFLQRGLRQMSIKQFVAIVNFFLNHIWGKRYVVGNNHVEDITQILQKLQYPHPVNKSWLKTPNTQHSFGNVIVLLDYLMDFVPPFLGDDVVPQSVEYFELQEPHEVMNGSRMTEDLFHIPDLEFQRELLLNTEEGFMLWDTQMNDEFSSLQRETCNLLIKKCCNFPDVAAIETEIKKLNIHLKSLQDFKPKDDKEMVRLEAKLTDEFDFLNKDLKAIQEEYHNLIRTQQQLSKERADAVSEVESMDVDVTALQEQINRQVCTVEQRNQLMTDLNHLEHVLAVEERTLRDLESRNHNQQVQYAKVLKQFTDHVETFNAFMRKIAFSDIPEIRKISSEELQLPLRPDENQLQKLIPLLVHIKDATQQTINERKKKTAISQQRAKELIDETDTKFKTELNSLRNRVAQSTVTFEKLYQQMKEQAASLNMSAQELQNQLSTAEKDIEQLQHMIEEKRSQIETLKEENESTMQQAEERHERYLAQRREFLDAYNDMLEQSVRSEVLKKLAEQVELQEQQLESLRKEFQTVDPENDMM